MKRLKEQKYIVESVMEAVLCNGKDKLESWLANED
jgi:hypothetical protein